MRTRGRGSKNSKLLQTSHMEAPHRMTHCGRLALTSCFQYFVWNVGYRCSLLVKPHPIRCRPLQSSKCDGIGPLINIHRLEPGMFVLNAPKSITVIIFNAFLVYQMIAVSSRKLGGISIQYVSLRKFRFRYLLYDIF